MTTIEYTKDQRDVWYFSDGYQAPAHIAVHHLAALRKAFNSWTSGRMTDDSIIIDTPDNED